MTAVRHAWIAVLHTYSLLWVKFVGFFVNVFFLFKRQNKVRLKVWVSLFLSNFFKVYSLEEKTFLSSKQAFNFLCSTIPP